MSNKPAPQPIYLKDYQVPSHVIEATELWVDIHPNKTSVNACLTMHRNPASVSINNSLRLDGQDLQLQQIKLNGEVLEASEYSVDEEGLTLQIGRAHV